MADLRALQDFAQSHGFGLTAPLSHAQVTDLAENWLPRVFFHEDERFHPISLSEAFRMVEDLFAGLPANAQEQWRVSKFVRDPAGPAGVIRAFDPPVVHVPDGLVSVGQNTVAFAARVLSENLPARDALELPVVDADARVTHGASFVRSAQFFGAKETAAGGTVASTGDPFLPRAARADGTPRITIMARYQNLLETLEYELLVEEADDYPPDGLRGGFDIAGSLFQGGPAGTFPESLRRQVLLDLIEAQQAGGGPATPQGLPPGWSLDAKAWDAVTRYAFLEYDCFYAYNDWERYQTTPFDNEHEGDDEGFCLVFDRNVINVAAAGNDPDLLLRAVPHSIMTCVHEENQDADLFQWISPPVPSDDPNHLPREDMELSVFVAGGSHATYLTPGRHDVVDFGDAFSTVSEISPILAALSLALTAGILVAIVDHFVDTEDFTSDTGIRTGPEAVVGPHPLGVRHRLIVLPMSADRHIYQPAEADLLRLRAFPGYWGDHSGFADKSPRFPAKTGRYFRNLLRNA